MRDSLRNIKIAISTSVVILVVIIIFYEKYKYAILYKNGAFTTGIVYKVWADNDTRYTEYYYTIRDTLYKRSIVGDYDLYTGDSFLLKYNKNNPKEVIIVRQSFWGDAIKK